MIVWILFFSCLFVILFNSRDKIIGIGKNMKIFNLNKIKVFFNKVKKVGFVNKWMKCLNFI